MHVFCGSLKPYLKVELMVIKSNAKFRFSEPLEIYSENQEVQVVGFCYLQFLTWCVKVLRVVFKPMLREQKYDIPPVALSS